MSVHSFEKKIVLQSTLPEAWAFFCNPENLKLITPDEMGFDIVGEVPKKMYPGLLIRYIVKPLFGIPTTWVTEITHVQEPNFFVDEQRVGPYNMWHHQHHFTETPEGILMHDIVTYILPFGFLGDLVHPLVKNKLNRIFDYRTTKIEQLFGNKK
ncbi:MAG: SRPBCC family protein [Cytophagaceae bacterium]|nr:SRPBCC family protein [Cytophagaceae bacterium]